MFNQSIDKNGAMQIIILNIFILTFYGASFLNCCMYLRR